MRVHEHGYRVELGADGEVRFLDPRGRSVDAVPPRPRPADVGLAAIRGQNRELAISARTGACRWDGRPVDYSAAIDGLLGSCRDADEDGDERERERAENDRVERQAQDAYLEEMLARRTSRLLGP